MSEVKKVLVLGSGGLKIGQAGEFDYIWSYESLAQAGGLRYVRGEQAREFVVGTEVGLLYRLRQENPDKVFHPLSPRMVCASMKLTTLPIVVNSLETMTHPVEIPEEIRGNPAPQPSLCSAHR